MQKHLTAWIISKKIEILVLWFKNLTNHAFAPTPILKSLIKQPHYDNANILKGVR